LNYIDGIQRGIDYIETNLHHDIDIAQVADAANMSRWHFQRIFKAITGVIQLNLISVLVDSVKR